MDVLGGLRPSGYRSWRTKRRLVRIWVKGWVVGTRRRIVCVVCLKRRVRSEGFWRVEVLEFLLGGILILVV